LRNEASGKHGLLPAHAPIRTERATFTALGSSLFRYLEEELNLPVNREKSEVVPSHKATFLGFGVMANKIRISMESRKRFRDRVRELTRRNNPLSMYQVVIKLNEYLRGWIGYFRVQEFKRPLEELDWFMRSRLRSMQLKKWKKPSKFQRMLIRAGMPVADAKKIWVNMRKWQSVSRASVKCLLNVKWFRRLGLIFLADYNSTNLELKLSH